MNMRLRSPRKKILLLGALVVVAATPLAISAQQGPPDTSRADRDIQVLEQMLADTSDPEMRASLSEKLQMAREDRANELAAKGGGARDPDDPANKAKMDSVPPIPQETPIRGGTRRQAGNGTILEGGFPPVSGGAFHVENAWYKDLGPQRRLVVWAGSSGPADPDPGQGLVYVIEETGESLGNFSVVKVVRASSSSPVRIEAATGDILDMRSEGGVQLRFNAATLTFDP